MSKLVQKPNPEFETRWTQLSGALNEVCDLVLSRKVASAGAIKDCKSQMEWYNVVYGMCTHSSTNTPSCTTGSGKLRASYAFFRRQSPRGKRETPP